MSTVGCCPVVELRQYRLRPGQREVLVELFDREFVASQEAVGMRIVGQFRDLDRPDRFVWLRGFADMDSRLAGLTAFYGGPVWKAHAATANATMLDIADVLLLRPVTSGAGFPVTSGAGFPIAAGPRPADSLVTVTVYPVATADTEAELLDFLHSRVDPVLLDTGRRPLAELRTRTAVNTFPALPIREGEHVVVRLARYPAAAAHADHLQRLSRSPTWRDELRPALHRRLTGPPQHLRLQPTPGSQLR
jgi:NIPSNAP